MPINRSFVATAFHESLPRGRTVGEFRLEGASLRFIGGDHDLPLSLPELKIERGGANGRMVFLSHPAHPHWSIGCSDKDFIKNLRSVAPPRLQDQFRELNRGVSKRQAWTLAVLLGLLLIMVGLWSVRHVIVGAAASVVPVSMEEKLGELVFSQMTGQMRVLDTPEVTRMLDELISPLMNAAKPSDYKFHTVIVEDPVPNAFALPGGYIAVNSGLVLQADRPEEVLGVLAHEMAHVTRRHGLKNMMQALGLVAVVQVLAGDLGSLVAVIAEKGAFLLQQSHSRDAEREADRLAVPLLVKAEVDPSGLVDFLSKLRKKSEDSPLGAWEKGLSLLSTHPATDERLSDLRKTIVGLEYEATPLKFDFKAFRQAISSQLSEAANP